MIQVNFPKPGFRIREHNSRKQIFDSQRKTWVLLTEEEWVRQNFLAYLVQELKYPASLIAVEKEMLLNGMKKRFDILVYANAHQPWMLVECKAPSVALSEKVLNQALIYNQSIPVEYIIITNGNGTVGWKRGNEGLEVLASMPLFM